MPNLKPSTNGTSKDDVCFLMSTTTILDEMLQEIETTTPRMIYCYKKSVGQKEFSVAIQNNLKSEMTIVIDHDEYDGEKVLEYDRVNYSIYRTFVRDDGDIELYCEVRIGGN